MAFATTPYLNTVAVSNYNSLQKTLRHTGSIWTGLIGYTFARSFDDASAMIDYANPFDAKRTYGLSSYNTNQNFIASYEVHLPFERRSHNGAIKQIVGCWSISGITRMYSRVPVGISDGEDYSLTGLSGVDFPYYTPGDVRKGQPTPG